MSGNRGAELERIVLVPKAKDDVLASMLRDWLAGSSLGGLKASLGEGDSELSL